MAGGGETLLLGALDAVEHLEFEARGGDGVGAGELLDAADERGVVGAEDGAGAVALRVGAEQQAGEREVVGVHVALFGEGFVGRLAASTIIQTAAHEDANIIFGAVLDEKMKDEVKITVIATGFKYTAKRDGEVSAAAAAISTARTSAAYVTATAAAGVRTGTIVAQRATGSLPARETPALDAVRDSVKDTVPHDDLDVPTFIRRRGETR